LGKGAGFVSGSDRHMDAVALLSELGLENAKQAASQLSRILSLKSEVEYSGDKFSESDANEMLTRVERFFNWAKKVLPPNILSS